MNYAYVGSFNYQGSEGIHICSFQPETGSLSLIKTVFPEVNAGHVCVVGDVLYSTDEQPCKPGAFPPGGGGRIFAFRIQPESGGLTLLSEVPTLAMNPAHITFDESGKYAIVSHFSIGAFVTKTVQAADGSWHAVTEGSDDITCLFRVNPDGSIGKLCDVYHHVNPEGPVSMIHKAYQRPGHNLYAENDLGADTLAFFTIDYEAEKLRYLSETKVCFHQEGPRHGVFHPSFPFLYINYERKGAVTRFDVSDVQNVKKADEYEFVSDTDLDRSRDAQSEIMFSTDGKTLYNFMRGKGLAVVFDVNENGALTLKQRMVLSVDDPRGADFTPDHRFIIVAGHNAGKTVTLRVKSDGTLEETDSFCAMAHPASTAFFCETL